MNGKNNDQKVVEAEGHHYYLDVDCCILRHCRDRETIINLPSCEMKNGKYIADIDIEYGCPAFSKERLVTIEIDQMVKIDPEGVARKYGLAPSEIPASDMELKCNRELLTRRLGGQLPTVSIKGQVFYTDIRLGLLRPKDQFISMGIDINRLYSDREDTSLSFFYNHEEFTDVPVPYLDPDMVKIPANLSAIEIPPLYVLDVIGYALKNYMIGKEQYPCTNNVKALIQSWEGTPLMDMIDRYPVRNDLKGKVIDWKDTIIPEKIQSNKERLGVKKARKGKRL